MVIEGSADYWRNRAACLRMWLSACHDPAAAARLLAALQEAEAEEERIAGLRLYAIRRSGGARRDRRRGSVRPGGPGVQAG